MVSDHSAEQPEALGRVTEQLVSDPEVRDEAEQHYGKLGRVVLVRGILLCELKQVDPTGHKDSARQLVAVELERGRRPAFGQEVEQRDQACVEADDGDDVEHLLRENGQI